MINQEIKRLFAFFSKSLNFLVFFFLIYKVNSTLERHCGFIVLSCNDDCLSMAEDITERPSEFKVAIEPTNPRNAHRILWNAPRTLLLPPLLPSTTITSFHARLHSTSLCYFSDMRFLSENIQKCLPQKWDNYGKSASFPLWEYQSHLKPTVLMLFNWFN